MVLYIVDLDSANLEMTSNLKVSPIVITHTSAFSGSQMQEASPKGSRIPSRNACVNYSTQPTGKGKNRLKGLNEDSAEVLLTDSRWLRIFWLSLQPKVGLGLFSVRTAHWSLPTTQSSIRQHWEAGKGNNFEYFNQSLSFTISSQKGKGQARTDITWLNGLLQKVSLNLSLFKGIIERL